MSRPRKLLKPYIDYLESVGLQILSATVTGSTHHRFTVTYKGKTRFFIVPNSTSDRRSFMNWKTDVRRWMYKIDAQE